MHGHDASRCGHNTACAPPIIKHTRNGYAELDVRLLRSVLFLPVEREWNSHPMRTDYRSQTPKSISNLPIRAPESNGRDELPGEFAHLNCTLSRCPDQVGPHFAMQARQFGANPFQVNYLLVNSLPVLFNQFLNSRSILQPIQHACYLAQRELQAAQQ